MRRLWLAVALMACGDVQQVPDAAIPDVYVPDTPEMVTCAAGEMNCNGNCANLMTSELYCGNCTTQCSPTQGCLAGSCVPANTSCQRVRELDPAATDGIYRNPNTGASMHCAFTAGLQYEIVINPYTSSPGAGFTPARAGDFSDANFVKAFIEMYNTEVGFRAAQTFQTSNCCMGPATGFRYNFGGQILFTGIGTAQYCNQQISAGTHVTFGKNAANYGMALPNDYFTSNPVTEAALQCSDGNNAAFWYKRTTF